MPALYCPTCEESYRVGSKRGERFCPEHPDTELQTPRKKSSSNPGRKGTAAFDRARRQFNNIVCAERCFFSTRDEYDEPRRPGHRCSYPLDAHHLVPKQFVTANFSDLPPDAYLAIIFNPLIGAPLCRRAHDQVTLHHESIHWEELRVEAIEFCESVDRTWLEIPTSSGTRRQSMLERLKLENPELQGEREDQTICSSCGDSGAVIVGDDEKPCPDCPTWPDPTPATRKGND